MRKPLEFGVFALGTATASLSSCATTGARSESPGIGKFYPATGMNLGLGALALSSAPNDFEDFGVSTLFFMGNLIDLPMSLASDTIFLPADLVTMLTKKQDQKEPAPAKGAN